MPKANVFITKTRIMTNEKEEDLSNGVFIVDVPLQVSQKV